MALTSEVFAMKDEHRAAVERLTAEQTTQLTRSWVALWDDLQDDLQDAVDKTLAAAAQGRTSYAAASRVRHIPGVMELVRERIAELADSAMDAVADQADTALKLGAYHSGALMAAQLPPGQVQIEVGFNRVPVEDLDAMILRTTEQIHSRRWPLTDDMVRAMKGELTRGVALGTNPRVVARQIMDRTEGKFAGGLTRALTIARTETMDAHRRGGLAADDANKDILTSWIWSCTFSGRTCPACLSKHGTRYPVTDPGPLGHQNCRCMRIPVTASWRDLGFDIDEPESAVPDAKAYFENLTEDSQRAILGKGRFEAYQDGRYPMTEWASLKHTDGWRDSYVVSPIPR